MRVVMRSGLDPSAILARLGRQDGVQIQSATTSPALAEAIAVSDVLVLPDMFYDDAVAQAVAARGAGLKLIQLISAGYDELTRRGMPTGVPVATVGDAWAPAVADHALALTLALIKRIPDIVHGQAAQTWDRSLTQGMGTLEGSTAVIVGFGAIGRAAARRLHGFGATVIGVNRSGRSDPAADEMTPVIQLHQVLPRADLVILALPYSDETAQMIGRAELALMKPSALLVNVARGGVVDTQALADALTARTLGGAGLDVTDPEPLPPGHPLWTCPNTLISPHVAIGCGPYGAGRIGDVVVESLNRLQSGQPIANLITS